MPTYILLTKISSDALKGTKSFKDLSNEVIQRLKNYCPEAKWIANYAITGSYDFLDIFEAPNDEIATKVSYIVRHFGQAETITWNAISWDEFIKGIENIK